MRHCAPPAPLPILASIPARPSARVSCLSTAQAPRSLRRRKLTEENVAFSVGFRVRKCPEIRNHAENMLFRATCGRVAPSRYFLRRRLLEAVRGVGRSPRAPHEAEYARDRRRVLDGARRAGPDVQPHHRSSSDPDGPQSEGSTVAHQRRHQTVDEGPTSDAGKAGEDGGEAGPATDRGGPQGYRRHRKTPPTASEREVGDEGESEAPGGARHRAGLCHERRGTPARGGRSPAVGRHHPIVAQTHMHWCAQRLCTSSIPHTGRPSSCSLPVKMSYTGAAGIPPCYHSTNWRFR